MPAVPRHKGYRFFFHCNEGEPREPGQVHVRGGGGEAKVWLRPTVAVAHSTGYTAHVLCELVQVAAEHRAHMERAWHDYFS